MTHSHARAHAPARAPGPQFRQSLAVWGTNSLSTGAVGFRTASIAQATAARRSSMAGSGAPHHSVRKASTLNGLGAIGEETTTQSIRKARVSRASSFIIPTDFSPAAVPGASSRKSMVGAFTPGGLTMVHDSATAQAMRTRQSISRGLFPAGEDDGSIGTLKVPKVKPDREPWMKDSSAAGASPGESHVRVPGESQVVLIPRSKLDEKYLGRVFVGLFVFYMVVNIDNGALPASLPAWEHDRKFDFSNSEIGTLGAIGYVGMIAGAPLSGFLFGRYAPKNILLAGFCGNTLMVYLFGGAPNKICLFVARFMIGFTQACIFVFAPVWVDNFASEQNSSLWMALMQAANPLGVMLGYLLSIIVQSMGVEHDGQKGNMGFCPYGCSDPWFTWRIPFLVQAVGLTVMGIMFSAIDPHYIDPATIDYDDDGDSDDGDAGSSSSDGGGGDAGGANGVGKDIQATPSAMVDVDIGLDSMGDPKASGVFGSDATVVEGEDDEDEDDFEEDVEIPATIGKQMLFLVRNPIYVYVVLTLSTMYFVVTGIQFWVTKYLTDEKDGLGYNLVMVGIGFAVVSATSPVAGVIFGGKSVQRIGGYKNVYAALQLCSYFAFAAVMAAVATAFVTIFWLIMITIWLLLFFGGAIVPVLTGILMAVTPQQLQPLASSMSITVFQILGYCLAPVLCGVIAEQKEFGLRGGFRVVLFWSGFGLLFNYFSMYWAHRRDLRKEERRKELKSLAMMGSLSNDGKATAETGGSDSDSEGDAARDVFQTHKGGAIVRQNPLADDML